MDLKLETGFSASHSVVPVVFAPFRSLVGKSKGFSLMEALFAVMILALVILAAFAALNYTLKITVASRNRMEAFAAAERVAVATLALGERVSDPQVNATRATINGALFINGVNQSLNIEAFIYKENNSYRLYKIMKIPVFVVFLKKTAS